MTDASAERFDVLVIGAGLSGIDAAYRLQTECPNKTYAILEARDAIGGTWDLFRYPGVRSDSDMYTLGFPFRPWPSARPIADGGDIRDYIVETAREFGIDAHIRFGHRVVRADWSSDEACWTIEVRTADGTRRMRSAFLYMASGYYDYADGYTPSFEGRDAFGGQVIHPQHWPEDFAADGKRIVVIGSGATAVTLVPALADRGAEVTMLQRSPTYIVARPGEDGFAQATHRWLPARIADQATRWRSILVGIATYAYARRKPDRMKALILAGVREQLPPGYEIARDFEPAYDPWDQRICLVPDADLFAAIRGGRARIVTDHIERFTATGIALKSGATLEADVVVTATGLVMRLMGGAALYVDGVAVDPAERMVYKGMMLSDVPNLALAFGYTNASWTLKCDLSARYMCRLIAHMDAKGYASCMPVGDGDVPSEPMLHFSSGYVQRANRILPHQGAKAPWRVHQNYVLDLAALRFGSLDDGTMRFAKAPGAAGRAPENRTGSGIPAPVIAAGAAVAVVGGLALFSRFVARRAEAQVPADGAFVTIDGERMHFLDRGTGPAIVMIHGLGGQMRNFSYALFEPLTRDHRVVLIDRPGSGYSTRAGGGGANLRAQAATIAKLITRLRLERSLVVGHSLGGAVALALAIDHPELVGALALIAPLSQPQDTPPEAFRALAIESPAIRRAVASTIAAPIGVATAARTASTVFAPEPVPADFAVRGGGALSVRPNNFHAASSDMVAANDDLADMVARYPDIAVATRILYGRDDAILDPAVHGTRLAAQIPGAVLTTIAGGHMIPITQPDAVLDWLTNPSVVGPAESSDQ